MREQKGFLPFISKSLGRVAYYPPGDFKQPGTNLNNLCVVVRGMMDSCHPELRFPGRMILDSPGTRSRPITLAELILRLCPAI